MPLTIDRSVCIVKGCQRKPGNGRKPPKSASVTASSTPPIGCSTRRVCGPSVSTACCRRPTRRRRRSISTSAARTNSWRRTSSAEPGRPSEHRGVPRRYTAVTTRAQVFRLGGGVGGVEGFPRLSVAAHGERAHRCGASGARHRSRSARVVRGAFPGVDDGGGSEGLESDGSRADGAVRRRRRGVRG